MSLFTRSLYRCGKPFTLQLREEKIINGLPREIFTDFQVEPIRGLFKTLRGKSVFDSTNTERVATHQVCIQYIEGVTSEMWILFKGKRIKILTVENCCENDEKLILMCTDRGDDSVVVNDA